MKWIELALLIVHAIALAADASPRAAVAVAVAVDEILQSKLPELPNTLEKPQAAEPVATKPAVTLVTTDNCSLCGQQAAILDRAGIKYATRNERLPTNKYTGYPVLEMDGRTPLVGLRQQADIERWMRGGK